MNVIKKNYSDEMFEFRFDEFKAFVVLDGKVKRIN